MGCIEEITHEKYPEQCDTVGRTVEVCFHYDTSRTIKGVVLRDDKGAPYQTIIRLEDGRIVRGVECQWSPPACENEDESHGGFDLPTTGLCF